MESMRRAAKESKKKQPNAQRRRIGLDKPCRVCGGEIYFGYRGPVPGVCGKCADRTVRSAPAPKPSPGKT